MSELRCSFCGKEKSSLISGPSVYICCNCVRLAVQVLDEGLVRADQEMVISISLQDAALIDNLSTLDPTDLMLSVRQMNPKSLTDFLGQLDGLLRTAMVDSLRKKIEGIGDVEQEIKRAYEHKCEKEKLEEKIKELVQATLG